MIILEKAIITGRDERGVPFAWVPKGELARFTTFKQFADYIDAHIHELDDNVMPLSGSALEAVAAINYIHEAKQGVAVL